MFTIRPPLWLRLSAGTLAIIFSMAIAFPSQAGEISASHRWEVSVRAPLDWLFRSVTLEPPNDDIPEDTVGGVGQ